MWMSGWRYRSISRLNHRHIDKSVPQSMRYIRQKGIGRSLKYGVTITPHHEPLRSIDPLHIERLIGSALLGQMLASQSAMREKC